MTSMDEEQLVRRIARGDRGAFDELYRRTSPWLAVRLRRRCADDELVAGAVSEVVVDVLEMIDVDEQQRADAGVGERDLDSRLQAVPVGKIRERVMHRQMLDAPRRQVLLGNVAGGAADSEHIAVLVMREPRVDPDPAIFRCRGSAKKLHQGQSVAPLIATFIA